MYLKRLELQGFKSFNTKTVLEFEPGITAVVGPNGSGKSNVAESLRWVLGEQSSRNVRARKMEDVIFSGSSTKAAVGMAEVSITLDNSEGWLPVDYSEVVVSRRAYRSGDSEYLINRNKVRLRDVLDLFLRAQVGQNSYAFMGQGLVEEVLVMRPEERRRLLEEAADVRLLRNRLDEARDRLAATKENLERVVLLIDEIAPRLRQLERQAGRAAEHASLARELAATLRELYSQLWVNAREAVLASRAAYDQRLQELTVSQDETTNIEEGLATLSNALEEQEKDFAGRRQAQRALNDQVHALDQRLTLDRERRESQTRRRGELEAEIQSLRGERADLQHSIDASQERSRAIQPEIDDAKALINTRRQDLAGLEQEQSALRRRIAEAEDQIQRSQRAAVEAENGLKRLAEEESRLKGETQRRAAQRKQVLQQLAVLRRSSSELSHRVNTLDDQMLDAEQERVGLTAMVESSRAAVFRLEGEVVELNSVANQLRGRQELLLRLQSAQEGIDTGVRHLIGDPESPESARTAEGLIGLLRDIVRVPPGLERAIEAALAENVQALVFENLNAALAAIDSLESNEAGRAVIYPLDQVRVTPPLNINNEKGLVGVASRLVRCDNAFRPLVDSLLGRTIVVEHLSFARDVLKRGLGSVVTLEGVLLRPNGSISGGLTRLAVESFNRQRELDELPPEIAETEAQHSDLTARLQRERETLTGAAAALARLQPRLDTLREQRTAAQNALMQGRGAFIVQRGELQSLWNDRRRGEQSQDWRARRQRFTAEIERARADAAEAAKNLERDREALQTLTTHRNEAVDTLSEASAAHAGLEGEFRSMGRQLEMVQANLARTEGQIRSREESLRAIDAEMKAMQDRGDTGDVELAALREQLQAMTNETEPAEGELAHLRSRERAMREQLNAARARLLVAERGFLEAEATAKMRGDEVEALEVTITGEGFRIEGDAVFAVAVERVAPAEEPHEQSIGLPPVRGGAAVDTDQLRRRVGELRNTIRGLGPVNEQAQADYGESKERHDFLRTQVDDLEGSQETLLSAIDELEGNIRERLKETFAVVDTEFTRYFTEFFNGGQASLSLTQPDDFANTGIDIIAQPPGKRVNNINMLSGGERTLTALALLLSLLQANPSPICVLDEVDAALDESNVGRFVEALKALEKRTQFVIITHNPRTIEAADVIYGVSMNSDNTSRVLSLRLTDVPENDQS